MTVVIQRVNSAELFADGKYKSRIGKGLYLLLCVTKEDTERDAELLAEKIYKLRVFSDENGKMNLALPDISGEVMVVSNFTLCANYSHGNRPDYFASASPIEASRLYEYFIARMSDKGVRVETGVFGADMRTELSTDGPVTIVMHSDVLKKNGGNKQ